MESDWLKTILWGPGGLLYWKFACKSRPRPNKPHLTSSASGAASSPGAMDSRSPYKLDLPGPSDAVVDDMAFISQFADVEEELPAPAFAAAPPSAAISGPSGSKGLVQKKAITSAVMRVRKRSDSDDADSEDEIEEFLIGGATRPKPVTVKK